MAGDRAAIVVVDVLSRKVRVLGSRLAGPPSVYRFKCAYPDGEDVKT